MADKGRVCECDICKHRPEFAFPGDLLADVLRGAVTIFAGAGISTESRAVLKQTFYGSVAEELKLRRPSLNFPALMEKYCEQPNGRLKLLSKIRQRFDHIDSFPELNGSATKFHRELGTFFPVRNIVTTNWDNYFEQHCKATPFVTDSDLAFWDAADRRVLKIHGSVANLGSIVATTSDYKECQERLRVGILGGLLKTILATETILFVGYSFSDFDFLAIYEFVKAQMGPLRKQGYVVTPDDGEARIFKEAGLIPMITDGAGFLVQTKKHAVAEGVMLPDDIYDAASRLRELVSLEHEVLHRAVKASRHPELIYAASYQDGMMHALGRAVEMRGTGQYSQPHRLLGAIEAYLRLEKEKLRNGVYEDVAYIEGYINALVYLLADCKQRRRPRVPLYYMFGVRVDIINLRDFIAALKRNPNAHKASLRRARRRLRMLSDPGSVEFHHPPWL
jgi:SIR2-like domain